VTTVSCDGDSDSSHVTGSCSPSDSVHDVPRARQHRRRLSRSSFPAGSPDVVQPPRTNDEHHSSATVVPTPLAGWCQPPLVVDYRSSATTILPELLGSDAYCRLAAAAAAASITGLYWGRQSDEKFGVDLMLPWQSVAAAAASFSLPTLTSNYPPTPDNPVSAMSLMSGSVLDGSSWLGMMRRALHTDGLGTDKVTVTPDSSGSSSPVDDLPLDLSPVAKRVRVDSPLTGVVAADACSV